MYKKFANKIYKKYLYIFTTHDFGLGSRNNSRGVLKNAWGSGNYAHDIDRGVQYPKESLINVTLVAHIVYVR